jgi:hypothetical protein
MADAVGAQATFLTGGILCVIGAAVFAWKFASVRAIVHEAYVKKGILVR